MTLTQFNEGLKTVAVLAFVSVCVFLCSTLVRANKVLSTVDATITTANVEIKSLDNTRKSVDDLLVQATTLVTDADDAATKESSVLDSFNTQVSDTLGDVNDAITAVTKSQTQITAQTVRTLGATTDAIIALKPVESALTKSVNDADEVVTKNAPAIAATVSNTATLTKNSADTMGHVSSTTADVQQAVHSYLHPKWWQKVESGVVDGAETFFKYFW